MKLTKYEHSCVVLEGDDESLVIDPGGLSRSFVSPSNCVGVVITHEHFDHLDQTKLQDVFSKNPEAILYTNSGVQAQLNEDLGQKTKIISPGDQVTIAGFNLHFTGGQHEEIREGLSPCVNVGVVVNNIYFHPGDEFCVTDVAYNWLGLPINAPWAKVKETNQYIKDTKPGNIIPIHDGLLNEAGMSTYETHIKAACEIVGAQYQPVAVGDSVTLIS